jgi:hypothetical protein
MRCITTPPDITHHNISLNRHINNMKWIVNILSKTMTTHTHTHTQRVKVFSVSNVFNLFTLYEREREREREGEKKRGYFVGWWNVVVLNFVFHATVWKNISSAKRVVEKNTRKCFVLISLYNKVLSKKGTNQKVFYWGSKKNKEINQHIEPVMRKSQNSRDNVSHWLPWTIFWRPGISLRG